MRDFKDNYKILFHFLKEKNLFIRWEIERLKWMKAARRHQPMEDNASSPEEILWRRSFSFSGTDEGYGYWAQVYRELIKLIEKRNIKV